MIIQGSSTPERPAAANPVDALPEHYSRQAAQHQWWALTAVARLDESAHGGMNPERQRTFLREALSEAGTARRLLRRAQQEAASRDVSVQLEMRLAKLQALVQSIERALYAPRADSQGQEGTGR
jgi:hypothetical protein